MDEFKKMKTIEELEEKIKHDTIYNVGQLISRLETMKKGPFGVKSLKKLNTLADMQFNLNDLKEIFEAAELYKDLPAKTAAEDNYRPLIKQALKKLRG